MASRAREPRSRRLGVTQGLGGAARPVGGAGEAHGCSHTLVQRHEMTERLLRLAQPSQRDPTGQPLGLGEILARREAVIGGHAIGLADGSLLKRTAGEHRSLGPPLVGANQGGDRGLDQEIARRVVASLASAPSQALIDQSGVVAQRFGYPGDGPVDVAGVAHQRQARLRQQPVVRTDSPQHALGLAVAVVPDQALDPLEMSLAPQVKAVALVEIVLLALAEVALDPGSADGLAPVRLITATDERHAVTGQPLGRERRMRLEPSQQHVVGQARRDRFLGPEAKAIHHGPGWMGGDEGGDVGE